MKCRALLSRAIASRRHVSGLSGHYLAYVHRGDEFRALAAEFCAEAGDELVPICRELLAECRAPSTGWLVAAILGRSRRADAYPLLKELAEKFRGTPDQADVYASAVYSIGLLRLKEGQDYLFDLFSKAGVERRNLGTKFGSALTAAVALCGKDGIPKLREAAMAELDPELVPDSNEGLRVFSWSYLSLVDSPDAFEDLKSIAEKDPDLRLRGMAIVALGRSSQPEQRAWLADFYVRNADPLIRRGILEALNDGMGVSSREWSEISDRMADPLMTILGSTQLPSGNEYIDFASIRLASSLNTPQSNKLVEDWIRAASIRTASGGIYDADSWWLDIAVHALAVQGASAEKFESLLRTAEIDPADRPYYWSSFLNAAKSSQGTPAVAGELISDIDRSEGITGRLINCMSALARIPEARQELEACLDRALFSERKDWGHFVLITPHAGEAALRPLERFLRTSSREGDFLGAAYSYLEALPEGRVLEPPIDSRIKSLLTSAALKTTDGKLYAQAVGRYYGRFGTSEDLGWLDSLPLSIPEDQPEVRKLLAAECARAADAIRLRN